jgi:phosphatidylserine/phosphatidylglycerophosphate/cardiolipin synthase-like enzyme
MIRPRAQAATNTAKNPRTLKLAAAAAAAILALAGCKGLTVTGAGASGAGGSGGDAAPAAPAQSGALITEPQAGFSPVYHLIKHARHSIDLTMYEFSDPTAEHDLAAAAKRGVTVKVVLDQREKSHNSAAFDYLKSHGVKVVWSSTRFEYTHQKTLLADGSTAVIMTANLTSEYYSSTRDFLVMDTRHADVAAIAQVFNADFAHRSIQPGDGRDLVWSPTGSQAKLLALIGGATKSLRIYSEEMGDTTIEDALIKAAKRGVNVKVCGENESGEYDSDFSRLAAAGVHISYYSSSHGFYIHGKVIEADYGTGHARVFIGSENFSSTSLNRNRELGLITANQKVLSAMATTFAHDYGHGKHWPS